MVALTLLSAGLVVLGLEAATAEGKGSETQAELQLTQAQIRQAEKALKEAGYNPGKVDGTWNSESETALKEFQKANGIQASGNFKSATAELLGVELAAPHDRPQTAQGEPKRLDKPQTATAEPGQHAGQKPSLGFSKGIVTSIEQALKDAGQDPGEVDGTWNAESEAALKEFQASHNLEPSGRLTTQTARALDLQISAAVDEDASPQPRASGSGAPGGPALKAGDGVIKSVEQALKDAGHDPGSVDTAWEAQSEQALEDFQKAKGLEATGELNGRTVAALRREVSLAATRQPVAPAVQEDLGKAQQLLQEAEDALHQRDIALAQQKLAQASEPLQAAAEDAEDRRQQTLSNAEQNLELATGALQQGKVDKARQSLNKTLAQLGKVMPPQEAAAAPPRDRQREITLDEVEHQLRQVNVALRREDVGRARESIEEARQQLGQAVEQVEGERKQPLRQVGNQLEEAAQALLAENLHGAKENLDEAQRQLQQLVGRPAEWPANEDPLTAALQELQQVGEALEQRNFGDAHQNVDQAEQKLQQMLRGATGLLERGLAQAQRELEQLSQAIATENLDLAWERLDEAEAQLRLNAEEEQQEAAADQQVEEEMNELQALRINPSEGVAAEQTGRARGGVVPESGPPLEAAVAPGPVGTRAVSVEELEGMQLAGAEGEVAGDVENVVVRDDDTFLIVGVDPTSGIAEKEVALPVSDLVLRDGRLVAPELTSQAIANMPAAELKQFRELGGQQQAELRVE